MEQPARKKLTEAGVLTEIRKFIVANFLYMRPDATLADDERLIERRIIDSMGVMELLGFLEESFGVRVPEQDIRESNLGSLRAIAAYVMAHGVTAGLL